MKKITALLLSAVMACTMLCMPAQAAETTTPSGIDHSNIGTEIEALAEANKDSYASFATAVFSGDEVL